jgi:hypothetical protein
MTDNVVSFAPKEEAQPHITGEAICGGCKHVWIAVVPSVEGELEPFECPECSCVKGRFRYEYSAPPGGSVYQHHCGGKDMFIMKRTATSQPAVHCRRCGDEATGWFE